MHSDLNKWEFTLIWVEMKNALKSFLKKNTKIAYIKQKQSRKKTIYKFENFNWLSFIVQNVL